MKQIKSRKAFLPLLLSLFTHSIMNAQPTPASHAGEYYLRGVMETASGFKLKEDSTFGFFFSYGALDRFGKGRWAVKNDTLILNSDAPPAQDFKLVSSLPANRNTLVVQIGDANHFFLRHFHCTIKGGGRVQEAMTNEKGIAVFQPQELDSIALRFEFCPEKKSVFDVTDKKARRFVFAPEPWLMDVFFQNFQLAFTPEGLSGGHPLATDKTFRYEKSR